MNITVIGRGNVGGGLAKRWRAAGHEVQELGRDGGDASDADVVLVAVPGGEIESGLSKVTGLAGKTAIDATNWFGSAERPPFPSLAHQVKAIVGGPVAKSFNLNFANLYDKIDEQPERPSNVYCADKEARGVTEQLIRDAGYEPIDAGDLDSARAMEDGLAVLIALSRAGGPVFYRDWRP
jgi:8-hydroxy-5-deazaflavin:NADPH oxidoreductase